MPGSGSARRTAGPACGTPTDPSPAAPGTPGPPRCAGPRPPGGPAATRIELQVGGRRAPTPLDVFLTARWALHTTVARQGLYVRNAHDPWPLHEARLVSLDDSLLAVAGFPGLAERPPDHVAFSPGVHTVFTFPRR
ncbi:DUF2071 domain-containing protein [Nocardioides ginkgobilobae]